MKLEAGKEMDKQCVINWLNEVYVAPSRAFSSYTDDELKTFAHDALVLLEEKGSVTVHDPGGFCPECNWVLGPGERPLTFAGTEDEFLKWE